MFGIGTCPAKLFLLVNCRSLTNKWRSEVKGMKGRVTGRLKETVRMNAQAGEADRLTMTVQSEGPARHMLRTRTEEVVGKKVMDAINIAMTTTEAVGKKVIVVFDIATTMTEIVETTDITGEAIMTDEAGSISVKHLEL